MPKKITIEEANRRIDRVRAVIEGKQKGGDAARELGLSRQMFCYLKKKYIHNIEAGVIRAQVIRREAYVKKILKNEAMTTIYAMLVAQPFLGPSECLRRLNRQGLALDWDRRKAWTAINKLKEIKDA